MSASVEWSKASKVDNRYDVWGLCFAGVVCVFGRAVVTCPRLLPQVIRFESDEFNEGRSEG